MNITPTTPPDLTATKPLPTVDLSSTDGDLRIYVADLTAYVSGSLKGGWIDVTNMTDVDEIWEEIDKRKLLGKSDCETSGLNEHAIHDHEGFPQGYVGEYTSFETIIEFAVAYEEMSDDDEWEAYCEYMSWRGETSPPDVEEFREAYCGYHENFADYVQELYEECYDPIPDALQYYIDWEAMARDWACTDYYVSGVRGGHVFHNC
ncbi:MAG: antirestriction protein ArdA [Cohaesibacteraceae bacterium]|nr:antirestriction protein ArdA [Cohaesibacteraceae bacterium]MBL4875758.1 antirestriction protein ArdA [Cohaesibacteraceae bacterium]